MIVIDKITGKSFRTKEEYEQFLKLVKEEKKKNAKKTSFNKNNLDASIVQHDFTNSKDW